jgi:glutathione synthase/RimK-type ligase-like ATP-grasp enzyme
MNFTIAHHGSNIRPIFPHQKAMPSAMHGAKILCTPSGVPYAEIWRRACLACKVPTIYQESWDFGTNRSHLTELCKDKMALGEALKLLGFPVVPMLLFSTSVTRRMKGLIGYPQALAMATKFGFPSQPIVVKANRGLGGHHVFRAHNAPELFAAVQAVNRAGRAGVVSPLVEAEAEIRVIIGTCPRTLQPRVELILEKQPLVVVGTGEDTLQQLLQKSGIREEVRERVLAEELALDASDKTSMDTILPVNVSKRCGWKHNVSCGGSVKMLDSASMPGVTQLATTIAAKLGLRFGAVDFFLTHGKALQVLEMNTLVTTDLFDHWDEEMVQAWVKDQLMVLERLQANQFASPLCLLGEDEHLEACANEEEPKPLWSWADVAAARNASLKTAGDKLGCNVVSVCDGYLSYVTHAKQTDGTTTVNMPEEPHDVDDDGDDGGAFLVGQDWGLNLQATVALTSDKVLTSKCLDMAGVPNVSHYDLQNWATAQPLLEQFLGESSNGTLVLKMRSGSGGHSVQRCSSWPAVERYLAQIECKNLCVCPFEDIEKEYRVFCLHGKPLLSYLKARPQIQGDGQRTLAQLLADNPVYLVNWMQSNGNKTPEELYLALGAVPAMGDVVLVNWKHNLEQGAFPKEPTFDVPLFLASLCQRTIDHLKLYAGAVDIIVTTTGDAKVLEVNACAGHDHFAQLFPREHAHLVSAYLAAALALNGGCRLLRQTHNYNRV